MRCASTTSSPLAQDLPASQGRFGKSRLPKFAAAAPPNSSSQLDPQPVASLPRLVHETNKDLFVLFTRWGEIGETGMFQRTPQGSKEEGMKDFGKAGQQLPSCRVEETAFFPGFFSSPNKENPPPPRQKNTHGHKDGCFFCCPLLSQKTRPDISFPLMVWFGCLEVRKCFPICPVQEGGPPRKPRIQTAKWEADFKMLLSSPRFPFNTTPRLAVVVSLSFPQNTTPVF